MIWVDGEVQVDVGWSMMQLCEVEVEENMELGA